MEKIVLFDIDGVILGDYNYQKFHSEVKSKCSLEEMKKFYCSGEKFLECEKGLISCEEFWNYVASKIGSEVNVNEYIKIHKSCKGKVFKDTLELMKLYKSKGYKIGILSNLKSIDISIYKELIGITKFDYEFYSCEMHCMKPSSDIFRMVSQNINLEQNEIYFIDNLIENCLEAEKWGLKTINATGLNILEKCKNL